MIRRRNLLRSALFAPFVITTTGVLMPVKKLSFDMFDVEEHRRVEAELAAYRQRAVQWTFNRSALPIEGPGGKIVGYGLKDFNRLLSAA